MALIVGGEAVDRLVSCAPDALLDAIHAASVVVDGAGTIVAANAAWRMFSLDNGGDIAAAGTGVSYLDVCHRAAAAGCADAAAVHAGLSAVLAGDTVEFELEYACPSPAADRWFLLRATPIAGHVPRVLVSHLNISRRKAAERALERSAAVDPLTGLANRTRFARRLESALTPRSGRPLVADVGVLFIDLDGFKAVNDTYGHGAGDEVLLEVAFRLSRLARAQDTVARFGGDEFAVVVPRTSGVGLTSLVERICTSLAAPHGIHGVAVRVSGSVGAYLAAPGEQPAYCLDRADQAMYTVKRNRSQPSRDR